ncbi:MAG TPA: hypothetical protein DCM28_12275 [Phycisphaerales bacterium]|nr:hypothetical protein [Phycisphaerales bacterium]HCD33442.1 hypothetical protein [Phycisphaerales bacterium]|tara:strand:- start:79 stop:312 length:234 start_codon:yes stop_codon:yes gene_type:complete
MNTHTLESEDKINKITSVPQALVAIASVICAFTMVIVIMIGIFARDQMIVAAYIAGVLSLMGLGMGAIAVKSANHRQ